MGRLTDDDGVRRFYEPPEVAMTSLALAGGDARDPVLMASRGDTRAEMSSLTRAKPFALREMKSAIRRSRTTCPVPLARPATRASSRAEARAHGEKAPSGDDAEIQRNQAQNTTVVSGRGDCEVAMERVRSMILLDQKQEARKVRNILSAGAARGGGVMASRELGLMQDRHSRSQQDLWALKRELKTVQHKVTGSSRELRKRIAERRPSTASPSLMGSYSGVLGAAMVAKAARGERGFGDALSNFSSSVALVRFTEHSIKAFQHHADAVYEQHKKGMRQHQAELASKLRSACYAQR